MGGTRLVKTGGEDSSPGAMSCAIRGSNGVVVQISVRAVGVVAIHPRPLIRH